MGMLDEVTAKLGGKKGMEGGIASMQRLFSSNGGLQGMTSKLTSSGLGQQVQSWIGTGENKPVSGQQVQQAMNPNDMHQMAKDAGMSDQEACDQVAKAMPEMMNRATPEGQIPHQDPFAKGMDSIKKMLKI